MASKVNAKLLKQLLTKVYLDGTMDECVLTVEESTGRIKAVDPTNSVMVDASQTELPLNDGEYSVTQMGKLVKHLNACSTGETNELICKVSKDGKWLTLRKGNSKFSVLLAQEPSSISTYFSEEPNFPEKVKQYTASVPLSAEFITNAEYYLGLFSGEGIVFTNITNGDKASENVKLKSYGGEYEHFELPVGKCEGLKEGFSVCVLGSQILPVLRNIRITSDSMLYFYHNFPVVVKQDDNNFWGVNAIMSM